MRTALLLCILPAGLSAQTLVSTVPQERTALLEEFTAINCGICPQGHAIAAGLVLDHPDDLVIVNVHGGGLADPGSGQPDFRTTDGNAIWTQFGVNAQPLGMVNRKPYNGQTVLSRTVWAAATNSVLALPAPVNLGIAAQFDPGSRDLTVQLEAYWTANGTGGNDRVHVLLTESNLIGYQQDYQNGAHPAYSHQHVLRAYISPLWGDEVVDNSMGHLEQLSYTFNVPMDQDIANCHVVAYVGEYQGEIYNAVEVGANSTATGLKDEGNASPMLVYPQPATDRLYIAFDSSEPIAYAITDLHGRMVMAASVTQAGGAVGIDVSTLPDGIYFLRSQDHAHRFVVAR